jgi:hypothetical protein
MRGTAEPAVAAATITPAEGRATAVEAPGEAILAVHDEPRRVSPPIQLTSSATPRVGRQGPERLVRAQFPSPSTGCRAAKRPPDQVASGVASPRNCSPLREGLWIFRIANPLRSCPEERSYVPKNRRSFTPEFKEEASKLVVQSSRPVASVAREISGCSPAPPIIPSPMVAGRGGAVRLRQSPTGG